MLNIGIPFLLISVLAADDQPAPKFPLGRDTTYFSSPLDKRGYLDYQAALHELFGKGITPERNANALLWRAFGPTPDGVRMPPDFFKRLGIEEPPPDGENLIALATYLKAHAKLDWPERNHILFDQQGRASNRPWKKKDYPYIADWLAANEKSLALVIEATRRPDYYHPLVSKGADDEPGSLFAFHFPANKYREVFRALTARAMLRVAEGKTEEAWQDLLACHRLGRLVARGATLGEALVGSALDSIASSADLVYLEYLAAMREKACLHDLQALPPLPALADKIDLGERVMYLDCVQLVRRGTINFDGSSCERPSTAKLKALALVDWEPALRNGNRWFDRLAAAQRLENRAERQGELAQIDADLKALAKKRQTIDIRGLAGVLAGKTTPSKLVGEITGDHLLLLLSPRMSAARNTQDRYQQAQRNLHIAFALAAFRRDNERYPDKLDGLAPKYLKSVPNDLFSGKPLIYLPEEKGYLLYSVGVNSQDEGGRCGDDVPPGDDLNVRMPLPELKVKK